MYLEDQLKVVMQQYNEAYSKRVQGDHINHVGICWYYSEPLNQYVSSVDYYVLSKLQYGKVLFTNKADAKKYQKYKRELYRLINIYIQKCIDDSLNKLEEVDINKEVLNQWKQEFWYR